MKRRFNAAAIEKAANELAETANSGSRRIAMQTVALAAMANDNWEGFEGTFLNARESLKEAVREVLLHAQK